MGSFLLQVELLVPGAEALPEVLPENLTWAQVIEVEARLLTGLFIQVGLVEGGRCPELLNAQVIE